MRTTLLIWPMLAQIAWTLVVGLMTGRARVASLRAREVRMGEIALGNDAWPDPVKKWGNNFSNQFESPILFYALCLVATLIAATHIVMVALAWIYVATRIAHTLIHTGSNNVNQRFFVYLGGLAALGLMLVGIVIALLR